MRRKYILLIIIAALIFVGAIMAYKSTPEKDIAYPEDAITVEGEIIDILFFDKDDTSAVLLDVIQDGKQDKDQIWLQKDTAIFDKNGKKLDFLDLKKGQSIKATTRSEVLYDNPQIDVSGSVVDGDTSNIYWRCYDVTILETK